MKAIPPKVDKAEALNKKRYHGCEPVERFIYMQKGFAPIFVLGGIALLAIVAGMVFLTKFTKPTSKINQNSSTSSSAIPIPSVNTSNWKTYKSDALGIELRYPDKYNSVHEGSRSLYIVKREPGKEQAIGIEGLQEAAFQLNFNNQANEPFYKTLKTCVVVLKELEHNPNSPRDNCIAKGSVIGQKQDVESLMLGGVPAVSYVQESTGQGGDWRVVETTQQPFLTISFYGNRDGLEIQNQILSSFKFISTDSAKLPTNVFPTDWKPICATEKHYTYEYTVSAGDSPTTLARWALVDYFNGLALSDQHISHPLTDTENVYAEDFIIKGMQFPTLKVGEKIKIPCELIEQAAFKARELSNKSKQNLTQYSTKSADLQMDEFIRQTIQNAVKDSGLNPTMIQMIQMK